MAAIDDFLGILQQGPSPADCVFNPWRDHDDRDGAPRRDTPTRRRENMAAYIEARSDSARVVLLGEAPSHRGCRFTGIAFCSETELVTKPALVAQRQLALTSIDAKTKPLRERSAAVIWGEIERAGKPFEVVLWNAFPWHPYLEARDETGPSGVKSNRRPKPSEAMQGLPAFEALMRCFAKRPDVFAVGKVAVDALERWGGVECAGYIRHPAQGGEALFREQFRRLVVPRL
ncbi:MAG TPA: uracil-DNA glycosylase [Usitatibacter sp.]